MFLLHRKIIIISFLSATLFLQVAALPSYSLAQDKQGGAALADFSVDLDSLPPQPIQSTLPEDSATEVIQSLTKEAASLPTSSTPPSDGLTPMMPETQAELAVDQLDVLPEPVPHSGQYFDSDSIVPDAAMRGAIGPREVDPKYEPGSRFVVVRKGAGPNSIPARIISAQRALKLGRYTSALEMYEQLYKKAPKNKQILMGLAVAQQYSGFKESAIATYEELLARDPKNTDATVNMLGLLKSEYPSVAYRKLRDLWDRNSQNPGLAAQLGLTSASIGNAQDAIRYLGIAATLQPENASHFYNMAVISDQAGATKDAVDLYQKALEVDISYGGGRTIPREQVYDRLAQLRRL